MDFRTQLTTPTLLLDETICRANIERMAKKAATHHLELIPHWKTAQSRMIGAWARDYGIRRITVASLRQASYLSDPAWDQIHIAFPFNIREISTLNDLSTSQSLSLQLINVPVAAYLAMHLTNPVDFMIEIDAGYGRTGVVMDDYQTIEGILDVAKKSTNLNFRGFYIHPGHTYYQKDSGKIYEESRTALSVLKNRYRNEYPQLVTRVGDTPGCSVSTDFGDIDEMGPGNFVFYDLTQARLGSCRKSDIAVALAVPIVDKVSSRRELLVHGGGVHLAKDSLLETDGSKCFGEVVLLNESGWIIPEESSFVKSISQEHGIIQASESLFDQVAIGDMIGILPVHSCMTADTMGAYLTTTGEWVDHAEARKISR